MRLAFCLLAVMAVVEISSLIFGQGSFAIAWACEDGSYYIQEALNLALGYGITFDRIAPTNASHWGWFFLLAGVFKLIPVTDPVTLFRIAGVTYFVLLLAAGCVIALRYPLSAVFFVAYLANRGMWYLETNLVFLTLALLYRWPGAVTGFLLVFARTDMVIFAGLFTMLSGRTRVAIGGAIGFASVCVLNLWIDGNAVSISSQIKSAGFNDFATVYRTAGHLAVYYFPVLEVTVVLSCLYLWRGHCDRILSSGFIASLALLSIHLLHNSGTEGWYLAPLFLSALLCGSALMQQVTASMAIGGPIRGSLMTSRSR